jgi:hypothetical protein
LDAAQGQGMGLLDMLKLQQSFELTLEKGKEKKSWV